MSFHPSGHVLAVASGQSVYLWDYKARGGRREKCSMLLLLVFGVGLSVGGTVVVMVVVWLIGLLLVVVFRFWKAVV